MLPSTSTLSGRCPRVLHSRPNAAMARGWARKNLGSAPAAEQLVQVVGGGRAGVGLDALLVVGVVQQPELAVVDQLVLLALPQRLDGQPELLLGLVHRLVVRSATRRVDPQHGLRDAQLVLARRALVVDERARQHVLAAVAGGHARWPPRRRGCVGFSAVAAYSRRCSCSDADCSATAVRTGPVEAQQRAGGSAA